MSTYEPCVLGSDGNCTRWSHDHAADRPPVTDDARAVREAAISLYRAMRRANPDAWAEVDEVEDWAYWDDIVRTAQVTLAAGRAETTTEQPCRHCGSCDGPPSCPDCDHADRRAETTTATTEDAVGELLERMSNAVTQLEALRDEHWYPPERQRLHGKVEGVKLAASYVEEARGLLATARTRPTREQVTAAIGDAANSMQVGFGVVSITAAVDAVMALLRGGDK